MTEMHATKPMQIKKRRSISNDLRGFDRSIV